MSGAMRSKRCCALAAACVWLGLSVGRTGLGAPPQLDDPFLETTVAELTRATRLLSERDEPMYWVAYGALDRRTIDVDATSGAASTVSRGHVRMGDVDLRVGSMALDNTHKLVDAGWFDDDLRPIIDLPIERDAGRATASAWWRATDERYRTAVRRLIKVRTNEQVKVARADTSADFSAAPATQSIGDVVPVEPEMSTWTDAVRQASTVFLEYPEVFDNNVSFHVDDDVRYLVTSDGSQIREQHVRVRVSVWAHTVADDGMSIEVYDYVDAASTERLPDVSGLVAMARSVAERATALRAAPVVEPYSGPAILRGRAAAVFFHEILGHRVEGHRQKDEDEGQTLTDKVGELIFPSFLHVHDDPTIREIGGVDLSGHYRFDDEGVVAQRVPIVESGVLRNFLMSRSPIRNFPVSNGHARRQAGAAPVARQGNLIVSASETISYEELRDRLIRQVKEQNKPFGLIFDDISGGFTFTGRSTPNSYAVQPVTVWRVYADGRPDELVRGVDLIGTPLMTFGRIVAASDTPDVFNGNCGAESGWVPVAAVSPDLLVSEVEVQRAQKDNDRPPLLPPPTVEHPSSASESP